MGKLDGKIAIVTGGTSGIGLATAKKFIDEGAFVFVTGRGQAELDGAVKLLGTQAHGVQGDVAKLSDLDRLYETVRSKKGRVDIVFANAGVANQNAPLGSITEEQFDLNIDINLKGLLFTVQKALPLMPAGGVILLNGSVATIKGFPATSVYGATKAAVRALARSWTLDLKEKKIRVNVISAGPTDTPAFGKFGMNEEQVQQLKTGIASAVPLGRLGESEDVAKAALFLVSDDSSHVAGTEIFVDGGMAQV
jgi:NAD(P)-dependent dehydrogenase (short-subunit alcohol dehydrogenase family)